MHNVSQRGKNCGFGLANLFTIDCNPTSVTEANMEHKRKRDEETRSTKRRRKKFNAGKHAFHVMDKLAPALLADPPVNDAVLSAALLCASTKHAMFHGLAHQEATVVRKRIFHGNDKDLVTRLRTYLRDLLSETHAEECHGLRDTAGCRAVDAWLMARVSAPIRLEANLDCRNLIDGHPCGPVVESS